MTKDIYFKQAVIFAGGRGERLKPLTDHLPKPMAPVHGRPFTDYLLKALVDSGIERILFLVGYRAEIIMGHYGKKLQGGVEIAYSIGSADDQTGRRLLNAYGQLENHFLLLYADNYWPLLLNSMKQNYLRLGLPVTTTVFSNKNGTAEYGFENNVIVDGENKVKAYDKSRRTQGLNGVDIGFFMVDKGVIDPGMAGNISFEEIILTRLAAEKSLGAYVTDEQYYYITSLESLRRFEEVVREKQIPAL